MEDMPRYQTIVGYGGAEEGILEHVKEKKLVTSKTEAWNRGLHGFNVLLDADPYPLFDLTARLLRGVAAYSDVPEKLEAAAAYALPIAKALHAVLIAKYGVVEAEFFEVFPGTLHTLNEALRHQEHEAIDREQLAEELRSLATFLDMRSRKMAGRHIRFDELFGGVPAPEAAVATAGGI